jgi:hypothetical protein
MLKALSRAIRRGRGIEVSEVQTAGRRAEGMAVDARGLYIDVSPMGWKGYKVLETQVIGVMVAAEAGLSSNFAHLRLPTSTYTHFLCEDRVKRVDK